MTHEYSRRWNCGTLLVFLVTACLACNALAEEMNAKSLLAPYLETVADKHSDVTRSLDAFRNLKFDEALELLERAKQADSTLPHPKLLLARMYFAAGKPLLGKLELERVAREFPDSCEAHILLGEIAFQEQQLDAAKKEFSKANELARSMSFTEYRKVKTAKRIRLGLALIAEKEEDWDRVIKALRPIFDADPTDPVSAMSLARGLLRKGNSKEAFSILQKNWNENKENVRRPKISIGLLLDEFGDKSRSIQAMKSAAESDAGDLPTQIQVCNWALETGHDDLAQQCAERAIGASDSSLESRLLMALVARYQGDYSDARRYLESVHLESPANLRAVIELAIVLSQIKGAENLSLQYAQVAVKLQPDLRQAGGRSAGIVLAHLLNKYGGENEAQQIVRKALAAGPIGVESGYYAAKILLDVDRKAAKSLFERCVQAERIFPGYEDAKKILETTDW